MYPATPAGRTAPLACRNKSCLWSRYEAQHGDLSSSDSMRLPWIRLSIETTRALPAGVTCGFEDSSKSFNNCMTKSEFTDCWTNSSAPLGDVITLSKYSRPITASSGWSRMAAATGEMHSSRDRASTQVQLLEIGFKRLSKPTTDAELFDVDKMRNRRGSGPKAGMCSSKTGWLCSNPQMEETISFVFSVS